MNQYIKVDGSSIYVEGSIYNKPGRVGWDIIHQEDITIQPHETKKIATDVRFPQGTSDFAVMVLLRSSYLTSGLIIPSVGLIDPNYYDYIFLVLHNSTDKPITIKQGDRVCQLVFIRQNSKTALYGTHWSSTRFV